MRTVVLQGNRALRARPGFDERALEFKILNLGPELLENGVIEQILVDAGRHYRLGGFRPEFGRFKVEKFEVVRA